MQSNAREPRERVFEAEESMSKTNEDHTLCTKEEHFNECGLESMLDDEKYLLHSILDS